MQKINLIVWGTGAYVCGSKNDNNDFGTIVPSIIEYQREYKNLDIIYFLYRKKNSLLNLKKKIFDAQKLSKVSFHTEYIYADVNNTRLKLDREFNKINKISAAIIVLPDHLHYVSSNYIISKKINLLVVKPFAINLNDGIRLVKKAEKANIIGAVEFHKRLDSANLMIKSKYLNNEIGNIHSCIVEYSQRKENLDLFSNWFDKSNLINYLGVHYIDLLYFISNARPSRVTAVGCLKKYKKKFIYHENISCLIEWVAPNGNKFNQYLNLGINDPNHSMAISNQKIKLIGSIGRIESDQTNRGLYFINDNKNSELINPYFSKSYLSNSKTMNWRGYGIKSIYNFILCVSSLSSFKNIEIAANQFNLTLFKEALLSTAVIEYATKSLKEGGKWKKIPKL